MTIEVIPMAGREYRLSKFSLEIGVVAFVVFALAGIVSVAAALLNLDGSFAHPVAAAVIFGVSWSCFSLLALWMIVSCLRHRLFVDSTMVRVKGCFEDREVRLAEIRQATWKSFTRPGALVLQEHNGILKIRFDNYTYEERLELIHYFRTVLDQCEQDGWEKFESRCMPPQVDYKELRLQMQGHLRFAAIAFAVAMPLMYAILIWQKLNDGLPDRNWFVVAIMPLAITGGILGLMWLTSRADLARARSRQEK